MKKLVLLAVAAGALLVAPSAMAQTAGGCQLDGTANFDQPLGTTAHDFTYSFTGTLTSCQSTESGAPAAGNVYAGVPFSANGETYTLPKAQGNGSCASSTTSGTSVIEWTDGTITVIDYETSGVTAAVGLTGGTGSSIQPDDGDGPALATTRYAGADAFGLLAFEADPTQCMSDSVSSAGIAGVTGLAQQ